MLDTEEKKLEKNSNNKRTDSDTLQNKPKRQKLDLWAFVQEQQEDQVNVSAASVELDKYLKEPVLLTNNDEKINIFEWWQANMNRFPLLYKLTPKYLSIPATSAPSERIFSKAGELKSDSRSRILPKHLNSIIFLNHNYVKLKK